MCPLSVRHRRRGPPPARRGAPRVKPRTLYIHVVERSKGRRQRPKGLPHQQPEGASGLGLIVRVHLTDGTAPLELAYPFPADDEANEDLEKIFAAAMQKKSHIYGLSVDGLRQLWIPARHIHHIEVVLARRVDEGNQPPEETPSGEGGGRP